MNYKIKSLIVVFGIVLFLFVIFFQNIDLLIEYIKNSPILGIPYFLLKLTQHIIAQYAFIPIGLVVFLFFFDRISTKSRLLAIPYFILVFPALSIAFAEEEFLPFNLIVSGIFFLFGIGIWKNKSWVYIAALILNIILLGGTAFLFNLVVGAPCEGLGCIGIAYVSTVSLYIIVFTILTSPLLWYSIRTKGNAGIDKKRIVVEVVVVEIVIVTIAGLAFGPSYLGLRSEITEHMSIHQPRWNQEQLEREQAVQRAVESGQILYPSDLPMGWKKESESIDKIPYVKYGVERQVLQVKQSSRSSLGGKSLEELGQDHWSKEQTLINGKPALYVTWHTGACTITDEIRELWWYDDDIFRSLYCSCPCTLSKNELVRIAESME